LAIRGAIVSVYWFCGYSTRASQIGLPLAISSATSRPSMIGAMTLFL